MGKGMPPWNELLNSNQEIYKLSVKVCEQAVNSLDKIKDKMREDVYLEVRSIIDQVESDIIKFS